MAAPIAPLQPLFVPLVGGRAAMLLGAALLIGFAVLTARAWTRPTGAGGDRSRESVVQLPVGPADAAPERTDKTAPDPGDDL